MKVAATRTQTVEGSITPADLLALVKETIHVPEGATATFHALDSGRMTGLMQQQISLASYGPSPVVQVDDSNPLRFRITWSLPFGKDEQG